MKNSLDNFSNGKTSFEDGVSEESASGKVSLEAFRNLYKQGFVRVAACTTPVVLADPPENARTIRETLEACDREGVAVAVFPELGLTGYTIEDLHFQQLLLESVEETLLRLAHETRALTTLAVIGLPLRQGDRLYNCAAVLHRGRILGVVPKTALPRYREFYEPRHFTSGAGATGSVRLGGEEVPFGTDLLFSADDVPGFVLGIEICEDLWAPHSPGMALAMAGATILANLSASPLTVGRASERHLLCEAQSMRGTCAYLYAAAGQGESTTDLAWDGQLTLHEAGRLLAESKRFPSGATRIVADVDVTLLTQERLRTGYFPGLQGAGLPGASGQSNKEARGNFREVRFTLSPPQGDLGLKRDVPRFPFVPANPQNLARDCEEIWEIQSQALCQRLRASGARSMVIGVSGGLDSALALLVAVRAADRLGWPRSSVLARTMPGFATGAESRRYADALMESLGVEAGVLDIRPAARSMLEGIGHPFGRGEKLYDVTFENVQAGLRTDFLFRLANQHNGLVIGTGDMSELALGWCTYGVGDQMAHYNVNAGLPKTLVQHVIRWAVQSESDFSPACRRVLEKIVNAEISPELVPDQGKGLQSTEAAIGPYPLQDFTLYYVLRHGFSPWRIAFLQEKAWGPESHAPWPGHYPESARHTYRLQEIASWMRVFMKRFFATSQFKRSAMPNGPKIMAGGALSPRGDWRAPSDGNARLWLRDVDRLAAVADNARAR